jgi:hypothetical protein
VGHVTCGTRRSDNDNDDDDAPLPLRLARETHQRPQVAVVHLRDAVEVQHANGDATPRRAAADREEVPQAVLVFERRACEMQRGTVTTLSHTHGAHAARAVVRKTTDECVR